MACVKHFALYGAAEAGREYNTTDMSHLTMFQFYLPPYKAAVDAGVGSVMTSFNDVEGIPSTANKWLLTDLLRNDWGFKGIIVSDFNSVQELIAHGIAKDYKQAAEKAINAGLDMDMASESFAASLKDLINEGKVSEKKVDEACRIVLGAKYDLGLFEHPFRGYDPKREERVTLTAANKKVAKEAALESIVLLKNNKQLLPIKNDVKIALIGPFSDSKRQMFSMWSFRGEVDSVVTILQGIKKQNPNVVSTPGSFVTNNAIFLKKSRGYYDEQEQQEMVKKAIDLAEKSDVVVAVLGESLTMSGEAKSRTDISIPACQRNLLSKLKATGKPVILILINGRPLTLTHDLQNADAIIEAWRPGTMAGDAIADILFGKYNPSGKLTMTFPRSVGQIPIYYNHKRTGRPYVDGERGGLLRFKSFYLDELNAPLFPFGYGLSYTTFEYGKISLSDTLLQGDNAILEAKIQIKNTGKYAGEETVQLYLNDPVASVAQPVKELKRFHKVFLQPAETEEVTFKITPEDLKFFNHALQWDWEPGEFRVYIGTDSENVKGATFDWEK